MERKIKRAILVALPLWVYSKSVADEENMKQIIISIKKKVNKWENENMRFIAWEELISYTNAIKKFCVIQLETMAEFIFAWSVALAAAAAAATVYSTSSISSVRATIDAYRHRTSVTPLNSLLYKMRFHAKEVLNIVVVATPAYTHTHTNTVWCAPDKDLCRNILCRFFLHSLKWYA